MLKTSRREFLISSAPVLVAPFFLPTLVSNVSAASMQPFWRFCTKCNSLFFHSRAEDVGRCAAGGGHSPAGYVFHLPYNTPGTPTAQSNWRFCGSCTGLFWNGYPDKGRCAAGGPHKMYGFDYVIPHDIAPNGNNQDMWRFCDKCKAMFYDGYPTKGSCPAGGGHNAAGYMFVLPHDLPNVIYRLPFDDDSSWVLSNGNWDDPKHGHNQGDANGLQANAFDFVHPEGGIIRAARGGTVYVVVDSESKNSYGRNFCEDGVGNYLVINHGDGTYGTYWHLSQNGVLVKVGDKVKVGDGIAKSGNTGNSTAPHLHFDVRTGWNLNYSKCNLNGTEFPSVRIFFEDKNHICWIPRVGDTLRSNNSPFQTLDTSTSEDTFKILYAVSQDGTLNWYRHDIKYPNGKSDPTTRLSPPKAVGSGWAGGVRDVMAMGQLGIYSLREDGTLTWYWHEGFADGSFNWRDSRDIAKGLTGFTQIVAQDEGVLYGLIEGDPGIFWGITKNYDAKKGPPSASVGLRLTSETINFAAFRLVFGGGKGVLYAIDRAGNLLWMKHNLYLSPLPDPGIKMPGSAEYLRWRAQWSGPVVIATGFTHVTKAFSPGEGHIYYITEKGRLSWRQHAGWENGTDKWNGVSWDMIADDWGDYKFAFARNTTSDIGSGNPKLENVVP